MTVKVLGVMADLAGDWRAQAFVDHVLQAVHRQRQ